MSMKLRLRKPDMDATITIRVLGRSIHTSRKMVVLLLAVLIAPIVLGLTLYSAYSASTMEKEILRNMMVTAEQGKNNIDYRMEQVEGSALSILTTVYPYIVSDASDKTEQILEYNTLTRLLAEYKGKQMISKLRLYVPGSKRYSTQRDTFYPLEDLLRLDSDGSDAQALRGTRWQEPQAISLSFGEKPIRVISCRTAITSTHNYERIVSVLNLDINVSEFNAVLSAGINEQATLFLVNASGVLLSHPDSARIGDAVFSEEVMQTIGAQDSGSMSLHEGGEKSLLVFTKLAAANWYLVMVVPRESVYDAGFFSLDMVRILIIVLMLFSFAIALVIAYHMVTESTLLRINNAIQRLESEGLEHLETEQGKVKIVKRNNKPSPLATLEQNADRMVMTIKALLDREYQNELDVKDYQMKALQAQINPHFLYNTLDVIKWMIVDGKTKDGIWMVNSLSRYFQLSLNKGRDIVRIEEEVELTRTYVGMMQKRFDEVFEAEYFIDPEAADCLIPKLSLQPIVENALLHGVLYAEKPAKRLHICALRNADEICVEVSDNGDGMDEETLRAIRENSMAERGYGISNVRKRLDLFAQGDAGFEVISSRENGTCITLRFPTRLMERPQKEQS